MTCLHRYLLSLIRTRQATTTTIAAAAATATANARSVPQERLANKNNSLFETKFQLPTAWGATHLLLHLTVHPGTNSSAAVSAKPS